MGTGGRLDTLYWTTATACSAQQAPVVSTVDEGSGIPNAAALATFS